VPIPTTAKAIDLHAPPTSRDDDERDAASHAASSDRARSLFRLPNGRLVAGINALDTRVLFNEVFESDMYWRHGIRPRPGSTVFDVGANIGMYSLCLDERFPDLHIHAFEPIPRVFDALARNARGCRNASVIPHAYGLSNHDGDEVFVFDRFMSYAGSSHLSELRKVLPRSVGGSQSGPFAPSRWASAILDESVMTGAIADGGLVRVLRRMLRTRSGRAAVTSGWLALYALLVVRRAIFLSRVRGRVRTLSDVKQELGVTTIDLLKIDVEGAELDVLGGVAEPDWRSIRQLVLELHDVDDRLVTCVRLLQAKGFRVVAEDEPRPARRLLKIHQLYASRG
jgi:FkbM family methyltransferase